MKSPSITGVECPRPGNSVFHMTLLVSLNVSGSFAMDATPCPEGPRHSGQSAAATFKQQTERQRRVREIMRGTQRIKA
jgi:hypothetical protein